MKTLSTKNDFVFLFCEHPLEPGKVDIDFIDEYNGVQQNDTTVYLCNYDALIDGNFHDALKKIKPSETMKSAIYRGWMITPIQYKGLYDNLLLRNYRLINTPEEYKNCHYLPDSLMFINNFTPETIYEKYADGQSIDRLIERADVFKDKPVIIKDYVKSEKHDWNTACFVENASDKGRLRRVIENFIDLRGNYLNEGIVVREYIKLKNLAVHSKSGMPLSEEYHLFFLNHTCIGVYNYWEEGEYNCVKPDLKQFEEIAKTVQSNFFTMDIARKEDGALIIIELGDGQVSGLPQKADRIGFYDEIKRVMADVC